MTEVPHLTELGKTLPFLKLNPFQFKIGLFLNIFFMSKLAI